MSSEPPAALPSATVLLVRDRPAFEVMMVRRHHQIEFASGALVFPGGKVEAADGDPAWAGHVLGPDTLGAAERACRVCAVRETFEESGILLAAAPDGGRPLAAPVSAEARERIAGGGGTFLGFVAEHGLRLDLSAMVPFAHWITPAAMPKRFDTRFYLVEAPADQLATSDGSETVDAEWIAPAEALRLGEARERILLFPTRLNLRLLAESGSAEAARRVAAARPLVPVEPSFERTAEGVRLTIPPDAGYGTVPLQAP